MAESMRDSTLKIKKKEKEFFHGLMDVDMRDHGKLASNTERAHLLIDKASKRSGSGSMENASGGMMT
jgi:hypothetical protein